MKKKIAIITGGNSSEYVISVKSAQLIIDNLDKEKYIPYRVEIKGLEWSIDVEGKNNISVNKDDFTFTVDNTKTGFDCALIMIHGTPGEDGKLQGYFDMLGLPYTSCDVLTSSLTFNKHFCKSYLKNFGVDTADSVLIKENSKVDIEEIEKKVGIPCFVKPNEGGSSFGVTKVNTIHNLEDAIQEALKEDNEVLIEKYIKGIELTCGVFKSKWNEYIFPITEIVSKKEFFDYEAKYTDGMSDEITPARISVDIENNCKNLSSKIYDLLNCRGIVRIDYIFSNNILYLLEINTIPGMSANSIVPKQIKSMNYSIKSILAELIDNILD
ncbi:MAG: D-alanine--D-alanine ligase [Bacteroidales bacterium]|nr:D-alanine--D-alanine ligase [Bacteroidales bacterium]